MRAATYQKPYSYRHRYCTGRFPRHCSLSSFAGFPSSKRRLQVNEVLSELPGRQACMHPSHEHLHMQHKARASETTPHGGTWRWRRQPRPCLAAKPANIPYATRAFATTESRGSTSAGDTGTRGTGWPLYKNRFRTSHTRLRTHSCTERVNNHSWPLAGRPACLAALHQHQKPACSAAAMNTSYLVCRCSAPSMDARLALAWPRRMHRIGGVT